MTRIGTSYKQHGLPDPGPRGWDSIVIGSGLGGLTAASMLARHAGQTVTRDQILLALRGIDFDGLDRSVDMRVSRLRRRLGDTPRDPRRIKTVWGKGYLFVAEGWDESPPLAPERP